MKYFLEYLFESMCKTENSYCLLSNTFLSLTVFMIAIAFFNFHVFDKIDILLQEKRIYLVIKASH